MEFYDHDFLDTNLISDENKLLFSNGWSFDRLDQNSHAFLPNTSCYQQVLQSYNDDYTFNEIYCSLLDELSAPQIIDSSSYNTLHHHTPLDTPPFLAQEDYVPLSMMEEEVPGLFGDELHSVELQSTCKMEPSQYSPEMPALNTGMCMERKKPQGQPSKNLMAERRRRKRVNDRLSMLRSIVPKISKMDRTSILGDTIDYMKELMEKINDLKQEIGVESNMADIFKDVKPDKILVKNSPQFDVERRNVDTRVEICCSGKSGLLLSSVNTLEALGLEIQQCVISCFSDFTMKASCSEELQQKTIISSEDIKQALFRSAGYRGKRL